MICLFKQKTAYEMRISDWSSDVCSSDLIVPYSEGTIFQVYAAPGLVTDIALQPGENLVAVASGDTARWVIGDTTTGDRKSVVEGKRVSVRVDFGGRRIIKKNTKASTC